MPSDRARTTLICEGVRHGLSIILGVLAQKGQRVAIPQDVYPVYWTIASLAGIKTLSVKVFPDFDLQSILDQAALADVSVTLLPSPLKLQGRFWTDREFSLATSWLRERPHRRLILDGVYSFGSPMDSRTTRLLETEQVIYLNSLSKGWLHEQLSGVAIVPESDFDVYADAFRKLTVQHEKLFCARELLLNFCHVPTTLMKAIEEKRGALLSLIKQTGLKTYPTERGYFVPVEAGASGLLNEHNILAIPVAAFGSRLPHWSVTSALLVGG